MKLQPEKHRSGKRRWGIILFLAIVIVAVPLLFFRTFTDDIVEQITQTISLQFSRELNEQMSEHISSALEYYFHELNTEYNALKNIEDLDEEKLQSFIADTKAGNQTSYLAFADDEGFIYEADGSYLGTMRVSLLGNLLRGTNESTVSDNVTIGGESYIMLGRVFEEPISMGDKKICIGLLGLHNEDLSEHIVFQSDYSGGYSSIIQKNGSYVAKNPAQTHGGLNLFSILGKYYAVSEEELKALKDAAKNGENYFLNAQAEGDGESYYLYFAPVENTEWYISSILPSSFIKSSVEGLRDTVERVYGVVIALLVVVAFIIVLQQIIAGNKLKESQEELEKALKLAEEASGAKTAFLFNMSHDIRTPMNAILGYTDIGLKHMEDAHLTRDSFQKIKMAGGHLLNLINDILEMSRIESGKMQLSEKPLDIRKAVSDTATMSRSLAVAKSIDFDMVMEDIRNPYIYGDELHMNEVMINLISNAVKYTPNGGKVRFIVSQVGDGADGVATFRFVVSDNGIGMSEDFQKRLFETFSREENTTMSKIEGTGLGLSIVKKIVDMAGGTIEVQSVQGQGSTFTVEIPFGTMDEKAVEELEAEKVKTEKISSTVNFSGKKVLLAEDNELNREIALDILEEVELEVDTAEDGHIAVEKVKEKGTDYYDFILMDIQMPVMDGYEATRQIRELPGGDTVPIIALSANAFEEDRKKSLAEGMNAHVAKPIDIQILLETMQSLSKE